jgi:mannosyltransferase OCH1-like enzyme
MRSDILRLEILARVGGVYLDTDVKPIRPLDDMCPPEVRAWAACEQLDIVSNAAMGFPANHPAMWHAVAVIEESFFERRYVGDQAGPGLLARVVTQYDDVALYPPAYFHPTVGESRSNPDAKQFLLGAHLFAGTWVEANRERYDVLWDANHGC